MSSDNKNRRLSNLAKIPLVAAVDHRIFLDKHGKDTRLKSLSRTERRKLNVKAKKLSLEYQKILRRISQSGAGYPIDKLLRELSFEYTHRYASSGVFNQPLSFNYFESFCKIKLIKNSIAPYAEPDFEYDHLFSIVDYFDFTTSNDNANFTLAQLKNLPEGKVFHFTTNGNIGDFTFLTVEGREFVVSGFSMIRHKNSLHWYLLGGEILSEQEWEDKTNHQLEIDIENIPPDKRPFLSESVTQNEKKVGAPVALEGTTTAVRTAIAGETDLSSFKHLEQLH
jgi:hypothetical protein